MRRQFFFSSSFNPHTEHLTSIRLQDIPGLANLYHTFKVLTRSPRLWPAFYAQVFM